MHFTKSLTFDKVLTDSLHLQERILEHFTEIPIISQTTKVYSPTHFFK